MEKRYNELRNMENPHIVKYVNGEDFAPGMYVTVYDEVEKPKSENEGFSPIMMLMPSKQESILKGMVLKIAAVNLPYIAVYVLSLPKDIGKAVIQAIAIDTRVFTIMKLNNAYCEALLGKNWEVLRDFVPDEKAPVVVEEGEPSDIDEE